MSADGRHVAWDCVANFSDEGFAIVGVDGARLGTITYENGAYDGACEYAGSAHLVCKRDGELQLLDPTGAATTLIAADVDQVYVIRGGASPRALGEATVMWFLDWRA